MDGFCRYLQWLHQNGMGKHDVVIANVGANWEASHVVYLEFVDGFNLDVELL